MRSFSSLFLVSFVLTNFPSLITGHTWLDCVKIKDPNDRYSQCVGFARGYVGRPPGTTFDVDNHYTNRVFNWDPSAPACNPLQINNQFQKAEFPRAHVQAGETVSALYLSNGHVNKDNPLTNSTHAFYWTGQQNQQITRMGELTPNNRLSSLQNFDDCVCGEWGSGDRSLWFPLRGVNGQNIACQAFFTVPPDTPSGIYQVVWYWTYNKHFNAPTPDNKEEYTTCFDIIVTGKDCKTPIDLPYIYTSNNYNNNSYPGPTYPTFQTDTTNGFTTNDNVERPHKIIDSIYPVGQVGLIAQSYGLSNAFYPNQRDICPDKVGGKAITQLAPVASPPPVCTTVSTTASNGQLTSVTSIVANAVTAAPNLTPLPPGSGPNYPQFQSSGLELVGSTAFNKPANDPPKKVCAILHNAPVDVPSSPGQTIAKPTPVALPGCEQDEGNFIYQVPILSNPPCFLQSLKDDAVAATSLPGGVSANDKSFDILIQYSANDYRAIVATLCKIDLKKCYATGRTAVAPGSGVVSISVFYYVTPPIGNDFYLSIWMAPQAVILSTPIPQAYRLDWKLYPFTVAALASKSGCPSIPSVTQPTDQAAPRNFPIVAPRNASFTLNVQYSAPTKRVIQAGLCQYDDLTNCAGISAVEAGATSGGVVDIDITLEACDPSTRYVWTIRSVDFETHNKTLIWSLFNGTCGNSDESTVTSTCLALSQQSCITEVELAATKLLVETVPSLPSSSTGIAATGGATGGVPNTAPNGLNTISGSEISSTASNINTANNNGGTNNNGGNGNVPSIPSNPTTTTPFYDQNPFINFIHTIHSSPENPNVIVTPFGNFTFGSGYTSRSVGQCLNNSSYSCSSAQSTFSALSNKGTTFVIGIITILIAVWL